MANSLATQNGALIAQVALKTLLEQFPFLNAITTDFSPESSLYSQVLNVKLPSAISATDYNTSTGYAVSDATQVDVPITINKHKAVTYAFNDQERSSTSQNLVERFAGNAAQALGLAMMNDLLALAITANFSNGTVTAAASFNRAKVIATGKTLNGRKVPTEGRYLLMNSDYAETLYGDTTIVANAGSPSDVVRSGKLGALHGFDTYEYYQLPTNAQSLAGIAGTPDALIIAARVPTMPATDTLGGFVETVTEPNTGLSLQVRSWYDFKLGAEYRTYTLMYGVAVGNSSSLQRLTTA